MFYELYFHETTMSQFSCEIAMINKHKHPVQRTLILQPQM